MMTFILYYYSAIALLRPWSMELEAERIRFKKNLREYQDELAYTSGIQPPLYLFANGQKAARKV